MLELVDLSIAKKNCSIALLLEYLSANKWRNSVIITHVVQKDQTGS